MPPLKGFEFNKKSKGRRQGKLMFGRGIAKGVSNLVK